MELFASLEMIKLNSFTFEIRLLPRNGTTFTNKKSKNSTKNLQKIWYL